MILSAHSFSLSAEFQSIFFLPASGNTDYIWLGTHGYFHFLFAIYSRLISKIIPHFQSLHTAVLQISVPGSVPVPLNFHFLDNTSIPKALIPSVY